MKGVNIMRKLKIPNGTGCEEYASNPAWITVPQAQARYNLSRGSIMKIAEDAGAIIRVGRSIRIIIERLDAAYAT